MDYKIGHSLDGDGKLDNSYKQGVIYLVTDVAKGLMHDTLCHIHLKQLKILF